jgi:hypothetical protein
MDASLRWHDTVRFELGTPDSVARAESQEGGEYFTAALALPRIASDDDGC